MHFFKTSKDKNYQNLKVESFTNKETVSYLSKYKINLFNNVNKNTQTSSFYKEIPRNKSFRFQVKRSGNLSDGIELVLHVHLHLGVGPPRDFDHQVEHIPGSAFRRPEESYS